MARLQRFILPGQPQHVIQRGNNRNVIFVSDADYLFYQEKLNEACLKFCCDVHAYVLMTNHVHLLLTPHEKKSIGKVMQSLGRYYVQYFNHKYRRTGTLWEGRYKAALIDSERYLLTCYRYIELNPVRAGMVEHPAEYKWSSYQYNALGEEDRLVTPHELYLRLASTPGNRQKNYTGLFSTHISQTSLDEIRSSTNKAWVVGSEHFKENVEKLTKRQSSPKRRGGHNRKTRSG